MSPSRGFSIVEIIIAAAIFTVTVAAFVIAFGVLRDTAANTEHRTKAALLLEEGAEALLLLRDNGWEDNIAPLSSGTAYFLYWNGTSYLLSGEEAPVADIYLRRVTLSPAYRNASGVLTSGGTVDPDTRRVLIEIVLIESGATLASAEMLIHNAYE